MEKFHESLRKPLRENHEPKVNEKRKMKHKESSLETEFQEKGALASVLEEYIRNFIYEKHSNEDQLSLKRSLIHDLIECIAQIALDFDEEKVCLIRYCGPVVHERLSRYLMSCFPCDAVSSNTFRFSYFLNKNHFLEMIYVLSKFIKDVENHSFNRSFYRVVQEDRISDNIIEQNTIFQQSKKSQEKQIEEKQNCWDQIIPTEQMNHLKTLVIQKTTNDQKQVNFAFKQVLNEVFSDDIIQKLIVERVVKKLKTL